MKRSILVNVGLVALCALGLLACKKPNFKAEAAKGITAGELIKKGESEIRRGKFEDGRRTLRFLEENLPSSPDFPRAKLLIADSFFFQGSPSYPEAAVEYQSFINYFPRHERKDYALYHLALCHYAAIENAERDQAETRRALDAFQRLVNEAPGSPYALEGKAKILQCWRRVAEHELNVGVFYVNSYHFYGAEKRLKGLLETYPDFVDRERAYFFLGEAMRQKFVPQDQLVAYQKEQLAKLQKETLKDLSVDELKKVREEQIKWSKDEVARYRDEARGFYQKLVESYPNTEWARRASDRLIEMGTSGVKEELDS
jgi:outer membrane protein assembly factor BamD